MSFLRTQAKISPAVAKLYRAEAVHVVFETERHAVEKLIPPPFHLADTSEATFFVASYGKTSFGALPYRESALFLKVTHEGQEGLYCPLMLVTDDVALVQGREVCGFPKKMAEIELHREENLVRASLRRKNKPLAELLFQFGEETSPEQIDPVFGNRMLLLRYFWHPELKGLDREASVVESVMEEAMTQAWKGKGELRFAPSPSDPLHEIPIRRVLRSTYRSGTFSLRPARILRLMDAKELTPFSFARYV